MCGVVFGDRAIVAVEEMADPGIAADEDELPRRRAGAELLEQPEKALDGDVHDVVGGFLAGREMDDMGDAAHRPLRTTSRSAIEPRTTSIRSARLDSAIVAEGADCDIAHDPDPPISRAIRFRPTFPVAPVTRTQHRFLPAAS